MTTILLKLLDDVNYQHNLLLIQVILPVIGPCPTIATGKFHFTPSQEAGLRLVSGYWRYKRILAGGTTGFVERIGLISNPPRRV